MKLSSFSGRDWSRAKARAKASVKDMAKELTELYSKRLNTEGFAFSEDMDMQSDFERRFEFEETEDQLRAVEEIKKDMESIEDAIARLLESSEQRGEKIAELRKEAGISQEKLAELLDISRQAVTKWESGKGLPDIENIVVLSEVFDKSTDFFLKEKPEALPDAKEEETLTVIPTKDFFWLKESINDIIEQFVNDNKDVDKKIHVQRYKGLGEMNPEQFTDKVSDVLAMEKSLANAMKTMLGINPAVHLVVPKSIARSEGKAVRVIDERNL